MAGIHTQKANMIREALATPPDVPVAKSKDLPEFGIDLLEQTRLDPRNGKTANGATHCGSHTPNLAGAFTLNRAILVLGVSLCAHLLRAGDVDSVSRSVVLLSDTVPVLEQVNGVTLEVGWKVPGTNVFIAKTRTITGTGLIIVSSNISYLVTAKHVAINMTPQCEVVMGGGEEGTASIQAF